MKIQYEQLKKALLLFSLFFTIYINSFCRKQNEWLDKNSNKSNIIPATLADMRLLLDNRIMYSDYIGLGNVGADNFFVDFNGWQNAGNLLKNSYTWEKDIFQGSVCYDWKYSYVRILQANAVLDGLNKVKISGDSSLFKQIKGEALFFRSITFYELLQLFAKPYNSAASSVDPGIVLRLTADVAVKAIRMPTEACYQQIIHDLEISRKYLPKESPYQIRPSALAAMMLLSKIYLVLEKYDMALTLAEEVLSQKNDLLDYNDYPPTPTFQTSFPSFGKNKEILFYAEQFSNFFTSPLSFYGQIDSVLYDKYDKNDLRKFLYYDTTNGVKFKGTYATTTGTCFNGLALNEILLIRAECNARQGKITEALKDINELLKKRWRKDEYIDITESDPENLLRIILLERRKELPFTGNIRWEDLRRLNKDPRFSIILRRNLNGQLFELTPNGNRYVYPIPPDEIKYSDIEQNPR